MFTVSRELPIQSNMKYTHITLDVGAAINPKRTSGVGGQFDLLPCGFSKNVSSKERVKRWFFVTFNIIIRHIFPENFIKIPQVVQKL